MLCEKYSEKYYYTHSTTIAVSVSPLSLYKGRLRRQSYCGGKTEGGHKNVYYFYQAAA